MLQTQVGSVLNQHMFHASLFLLTLKSSVSMSLLGTLTALTCRAGPLSLTPLSLELGVTQRITGWVVPSSWLSTWYEAQGHCVKACW